MRTTVSIDPDLLRRAKQHAAKADQSLSKFIENAIREVLARRSAPRRVKAVRLPTVKGTPRAGVNYDSFAELMELTETPV